MLSRRNVRIKVMQILYATTRTEKASPGDSIRGYRQLVENSFHLYLYNLLCLLRVAEYARQDKARKTSKLRPSAEDLAFTAKLADNDLVQSLSKNFAFTSACNKAKLGQKIDPDIIRKIYLAFAKTDDYKSYLLAETTSNADHLATFLILYKFILNEETFADMVEDHFPLWSDDKSLVVGAMKKTIKALPAQEDFLSRYEPGKDTIEEFGEALLRKVVDADTELIGVIEPSLNNWDVDRVAVLDMVVLKMAIAEFLYFPSIPTKVTLNEFVEISKLYSTDKSKDFINGILDRQLKDLTEKGLINKEGRGLVGD